MPPVSLVTKLAGLWVAKKVVLFGAIKMYGPGRLYRRTLSWNRYLLGSVPSLRRGGAQGLKFMFRLPDRLMGKQGKGPGTAVAVASSTLARQARAAKAAGAAAEARQRGPRGSVMSQAIVGFSAAPLVEGARAAKQRVYRSLPSRESIKSTIVQGGKRATSLLRTPAAMQRPALMSSSCADAGDVDRIVMDQLRRIRSLYLQAQQPANKCPACA